MFKRILKWLKLKIINKKEWQKGERRMATKTIKVPRGKISSAEFDKHTAVGVIRRIGKSVVVVDECGSLVPISHEYVKSLKTSALRNRHSAIIKANGLSRAQVGRIAGDLKEGSSVDVYIRRVPTPKSNKPQATNFEILLMDGNNNEGKKGSS